MTMYDPLKLNFPWMIGDRCPCDSGYFYEYCCRMPNGMPLIKIPTLVPGGQITGFQNKKCYLGDTQNCSQEITGEHVVSASILRQLSSGIKVYGLPGQQDGELKQVGINSLTSNILCKRHNQAFSPLDTAAGHFFSKITAAVKHAQMKSVVKKTENFLVSGDAFERWAVKTAMNFYYSKIARGHGESLRKTHTFDVNQALGLLSDGPLPLPLGLYVTMEDPIHYSEQINFAPIMHRDFPMLCGIKIQLPGLTLAIIIDAAKTNNDYFAGTSVHRPSLIVLDGPKRSSHVFMTWPEQGLTGNLVRHTVY